MTSELDNADNNVESIDVDASDALDSSLLEEIGEVELTAQAADGDFDDEQALDEDIDEENSEDPDEGAEDASEAAYGDLDEADSDEEADSEDFDDDDAAEGTDDDAQPAAFVETPAPIRHTVVIETLPITGEPRVDDALSRLSDLEGLPVHEHGDVFEDVRRRLHGTLSDLSGQ